MRMVFRYSAVRAKAAVQAVTITIFMPQVLIQIGTAAGRLPLEEAVMMLAETR